MSKSANWKVKKINVPFLIISIVLFLRKKTQTHHWVWAIIKFRVKFNLVFFFFLYCPWRNSLQPMNSCISNCRHVADFQQEIHWLNKKRVHFFSFLTFIPSCGYKTPIFTAAHFQDCVQYPKCFHYWTVLHVKSPLRIVGVAVSFPLLCFAVCRLNTTVAPLFYADQFLQMSTSLSTAFIYGLAEHRTAFLQDVHWNTLSMWARDEPPTVRENLFSIVLFCDLKYRC